MMTRSYLPVAVMIAAAALLSGCEEDDTGLCCRALSDEGRMAVPTPEFQMDGSPRDRVARHPAFECSDLACVSWRASEAFCTKKCKDAKGCPDGFACETVLEADPGPGAPITPQDKFCVRATCSGSATCPEGFSCQPGPTASAGATATASYCVRDAHTCANNP